MKLIPPIEHFKTMMTAGVCGWYKSVAILIVWLGGKLRMFSIVEVVA